MESPKKPDTIEHFLNIIPQEGNVAKIFLDDKELKGVSKVDFMMDKDTGGLKALSLVFNKIAYKIEGEVNEN